MTIRLGRAAAVLIAALAASSASAFQAPKTKSSAAFGVGKNAPPNAAPASPSSPTTPLPRSGTELQVTDYMKDVSYGEESRKYRRTVYTHDDWVKHRAPDRFLRNTVNMLTSGIYKNIWNECIFVTAVAAFVCAYNGATQGYVDLEGVQHAGSGGLPPLVLPLAPFTVVSSSLGLLLVFRTNAAFKRWDEARKNWGMNINHTRDLVRMGTVWYDDSHDPNPAKRKEDLDALALATWSFVRAMKRHLSPEGEDEADFKLELYDRLPKAQADAIINAAHRPNRALYDLGIAIENLPMHWLRKNEINGAVTIFEDNLGSSERILTSPVPLFYSRHTSRFLFFWLTFLPLGLYDSFKDTWNHAGLVAAMPFIALFLIGIDELANQMEEPFTILPMQAFCDKIYNWCTEIVSWTPGDNGQKVAEKSEFQSALTTNYINVEVPSGTGANVVGAPPAPSAADVNGDGATSKFARIKSTFRSK